MERGRNLGGGEAGRRRGREIKNEKGEEGKKRMERRTKGKKEWKRGGKIMKKSREK